MAAPTVRSVGTSAAAANGNVTPGTPSGMAAGDLLIALITTKDNVDPTMSGFAEITDGAATLPLRLSSVRQTQCLWKNAAGGDSLVVTHTAGNSIIAQVLAITAGTWNTADPFGGFAHSETDLVIPDLATEIADCLMFLGLHASDDVASGTVFSAYSWGGLTWTARMDTFTSLGTDQSFGAATAPNPNTAAPGVGSYASASAGAETAILFAIRPAAAGAVPTPLYPTIPQGAGAER